jgi:hypothetical protein
MFAIFKNDELVNFWSNQPGDVFITATCRNLKMDESQVDLVHFIGLDAIPEHYEFSASKQLIIKEKRINIVEVSSADAEGNPVIVQEEEVSFTIKQTLEPEVFFAKGIMVKPC